MKSILILSVLIITALLYGIEVRTQTDWSDGSGVPGPVTEWGAAFSEDSLLLFATAGELMLGTCYDPISHHISGDGWDCVITADIDADGDPDVCAANIDLALRWWENTDGTGSAWAQHTVSSEVGLGWVSAADVDGDGDLDLLSSNCMDNDYSWWENTDGTGTSWSKHTIGGNMIEARSVNGVDIDGDGDIDALGTALYESEIALYLNEDGAGTSWSKHEVDSEDGAIMVTSVDLDADGYIDVLTGGPYGVIWYRNNDGSGTSWTKHIVIEGNNWDLLTVEPADMDNDGDLDVVYAGTFQKITWCENTDGSGTAWTDHELTDCYSSGAMAAAVGDFDGDGTNDIVAGFDWVDEVVWWANEDGSGTQWTRYKVDDLNTPYSFCTEDLDADGSIDIVGCGYKHLRWWKPIWEPLAGDLTSSILDTDNNATWHDIMWSARIPLGTSISFLVRSSSDTSDMGAWSDTLDLPCSLAGVLDDGDRYVQYRAVLQRLSADMIPVLEDVSVSFSPNDIGVVPYMYCLYPPAPNPTGGPVTLRFDLPLAGHARLTVYDMSGRVVAVPYDTESVPGEYSVEVTGLRPGVYLVRIESDPWSATEKLVVLDSGE